MACRLPPPTSEGRFEGCPVDNGTSIGEVGTVEESALTTVDVWNGDAVIAVNGSMAPSRRHRRVDDAAVKSTADRLSPAVQS